MQDTQSSVMVTCISMLGQGGLHGVLETVQMVMVSGYRAGVSPGVQHLPELLSVSETNRVHGSIGRRGKIHGFIKEVDGVTEIFVLLVKLNDDCKTIDHDKLSTLNGISYRMVNV